jgi:hypothetical protein
MDPKVVRSLRDSSSFNWSAKDGNTYPVRVFKVEAEICWVKPQSGPFVGQLCAAGYNTLSLPEDQTTQTTQETAQIQTEPESEEPASPVVPEQNDQRPVPVRERPGHFIVDLTNSRIWGGGAKGWIELSKVQTIQAMIKVGNAYGSMNDFIRGGMPKWEGTYDPKNLKVMAATQVYQMAGVDQMPTDAPSIPLSSTRISVATINSSDVVPDDVLDLKRQEGVLFNKILELKRSKKIIQPRIEAAQLTIREGQVIDEEIERTREALVLAQQISLSKLISSIPGLESVQESSLSSLASST